MQLVRGSLVSCEGHTFLKACGGERLLVLLVPPTQPRAQTGSSPRQQLRGGGLFSPSDNWGEVSCSQDNWGLHLHGPHQQ